MRAQELLNAFESLDSELLYAAHAEPRRRHSFGKLPIAAAILLMLIAGAVLYGVFVSPSSTIWLEGRESVTITLNSRGNVLSASGYTALGGKSAEYAVGVIVRDMIDNGSLDDRENTLVIGTRKLSEDERDILCDTVRDVYAQSRFHGATISLPCSDKGARAELIRLLSESVEGFTAESLRGLSVNDLNLLLHEYGVDDGVSFSGEPSEGMYIGKAAAKERALQSAKLDGEITVSYSVYHGRMVYLVRIVKGDRAQAYFINASNGTIETAFTTMPEKLEEMIEAEVKKSSPPVTYDDHSAPLVVTNDPQTIETVNGAQPTTATEPHRVTPVTQTITAPPVNPTPQPTTAASSNPEPSSTETPTAEPAETPMVYMDSLIVNIPYSELIQYPVKISNGGYGQSIPLTSITPFYQWQMNWRSVSPPIPKSQVNKMGKQDKCITVFCTYDDFAAYSLDSDSEWNEYLKMMQEDKRFSEEFFRENALVMVWYSDFNVYTNEVDSICSIETNEETAYVSMLREYRPEATYYIDTDVYKCVVSAMIKKSDIQRIKDLKLIVMTQSEQ